MEFFGSDLGLRELEIRALRVPAMHREDEPGLMRSRWPEYWGLHPVTATYLFAEHYKRQVKEFAESFVDIHTADQARAFAPNDIFLSRDMSPMWLARAAADRVGVPYGVALGFAQRRSLERLYSRLCRPNQLYGEEFEGDLADYWKTLCAASLQYCRGDEFSASAHQGAGPLPPRLETHKQLLERQINDRPEPRAGLIARMLREDRLHTSWNLAFTPDEIRVAAQRAGH